MKQFIIMLLVLILDVAINAYAQDFNPLTDTGQTHCYDLQGNVITCPIIGQPLYGQDAQYLGAAPKFQENGNGTITDLNTGLIWRKETADTNGDGSINLSDKTNWWNAKNYCENLNFAGFSDWQLPTIFVLQSIYDYGRAYPPAVVNPIFEVRDNYYWSSTPDINNSDQAWEVGPNGGIGVNPKTRLDYIRCVRGQKPAVNNPYVDYDDGTIGDKRTGLVWQQSTVDMNDDGRIAPGDDKIKWQTALNYCESLSLAGRSDWRLPNIRELLSIVDITRYLPSIDPIFNSSNGGHWSSTTGAENSSPGMNKTSDAWNVFFVSGNDYWDNKESGLHYVRCVRSGLGGERKIVTIINYILLMSDE